MSYGVAGGALNLRGAGSITGADAAAMSWDAFGRQVAAGSLSGSANIESTGESPAALMGHLQGWAKARASDGELSGVDVGLGLRALALGQPAAVMPALRAGRTPFRSFDVSLRLADGVATVADATMRGPDATLTVTGHADVGGRAVDLHAVAATPGGRRPGREGAVALRRDRLARQGGVLARDRRRGPTVRAPLNTSPGAVPRSALLPVSSKRLRPREDP